MARSATATQHAREGLTRLFASHKFSVAGCLFLILCGGIGLQLTSGLSDPYDRSTRQGLWRLMASMQLVQAFRGDPARPAPSLWSQRLGLRRAQELWKRQGVGVWWQVWSTDGEAYLVLPSPLVPSSDRAALMITSVDGLVVGGADPLHREQLQQRLASVRQQSPSNSLTQECLSRLERGPSVVWSSDGLASVSGTLAPLLQRVSHGCLSLDLRGQSLRWHGVVGRRPLQASSPSLRSNPSTLSPEASQKGDQALLSIRGSHLGDVLGALLSRRIIQTPLESEYGINQSARLRLAQTPFHLRLIEQAKGPFQAGLQIQLPLKGGVNQWHSTLERIDGRLQERGMKVETSSATGVLVRDPERQGSPLVGGWRWLGEKDQQGLLSVGLGVTPSNKRLEPLPQTDGERPMLQLEAQPQILQSLGLLPGHWPRVVRESRQLSLDLRPISPTGGGTDWLNCSGVLHFKT